MLIDISGVLASETLQRFPRVFGAGADGSRSKLSTIAGSMVTVAGARRPDIRELLDLSFDEIRRGAGCHPRVLVHALGALELIGVAARSHERVLAVVQQRDLYHHTVLELPAADPARMTAAAACERVRRELVRKQLFSS